MASNSASHISAYGNNCFRRAVDRVTWSWRCIPIRKMAPPWKTTARKRCVGSPYIIPDKDSDPPHRKNTSAAWLSMGWRVVPDVPLFAGGGPRLWSIEAKNRPYHEILRMKFLNFISIESSVWIKWASSRLRELQVLDGVTPVPGMHVGWYMAFIVLYLDKMEDFMWPCIV